MLGCRHVPISLASSLRRLSSSRDAPSLLLILFTTTTSPCWASSTPASSLVSPLPRMTTRYVVAVAPFPSISAAPCMSVATSNSTQHPSKRTVSSRATVELAPDVDLARGRLAAFLFLSKSTAQSAAATSDATAEPTADMIITTIHRPWIFPLAALDPPDA